VTWEANLPLSFAQFLLGTKGNTHEYMYSTLHASHQLELRAQLVALQRLPPLEAVAPDPVAEHVADVVPRNQRLRVVHLVGNMQSSALLVREQVGLPPSFPNGVFVPWWLKLPC
jgi:hypothetical protein